MIAMYARGCVKWRTPEPTKRSAGSVYTGEAYRQDSGGRRLQVLQHRQHAPVAVWARREIELEEDAAHVRLDRAARQEQPLRDRLVRQPLGHQRQPLPLAPRQLLERVLHARAA